jgi:hypothetical protein
MATIEEQTHLLENGDSITIVRKSGRWHTYTVNGSEPMPSATSLIGHIDAGAFQIGMNWAMKVARENGNDLEAPNRVGKEAIEQGNALHADIDAFIKAQEVNEMNPAFVSWLKEIGTQWNWLDSEVFVYNPDLQYGGTLDALSQENHHLTLWDWKTKDPVSYAANGGSLKDHAQVGGYISALRKMGSAYNPEFANIAYVMRDGSGVDIVEVDIDASMAMFYLAGSMKNMVTELKHMTLPPSKR